jgi:hypothetical protein
MKLIGFVPKWRLDMKALLLILVMLMAWPTVYANDNDSGSGMSCSYIGSWFGYNASEDIAWTSQAVGPNRSGGTMLLELPGFDVTFGGVHDIANYTGNLKGVWKKTGRSTFSYAGYSFATNADGEAVWVIRLTGDVAVVGDCDVLEVSNTWMSIYLVDPATDPIPVWMRNPDIGPLPFAPHNGYRVELEFP